MTIETKAQGPSMDEAWEYISTWRSMVSADAVGSDDDSVLAALVAVNTIGRTKETAEIDAAIGKTLFSSLGDTVGVELYDPRRILMGLTPTHPEGMPMHGCIEMRRSFENNATLIHIGVDGELYLPGPEVNSVSSAAMGAASKEAVLNYLEIRVDAHTSTS